jgi:FMN phosphatase YigB (HAD superfamily)
VRNDDVATVNRTGVRLDVNPVRAVVFDLDGTLYPGDATLEYYLERVLEGGGGMSGTKETVLRETLTVLDGTHPSLRLGDFVRGLPGEEDFDSIQLPPDTPTGELPNEWTYLGDGWTVVYYLTRAARIERQTYIDAFHASRYAMSSGELDHAPSVRLRTVLMELKQVGIRLVMQSNSSEDSGWPTLRYLGLDSVFDEYVFTAEKPAGMGALFARLREGYGIDPAMVLSVGDHPWNDIAAARELGGQSLLISPFAGLSGTGFEPRIRTVSELADALAALAATTRDRLSTFNPN